MTTRKSHKVDQKYESGKNVADTISDGHERGGIAGEGLLATVSVVEAIVEEDFRTSDNGRINKPDNGD